jgi:hypothetical protein
VFNQRHHRHGIYRLLPTARYDCDHDGTGSSPTDTDAAAEAQGRKENSAEDRGVNRGALAVARGVACADAVKNDTRELGVRWEPTFATR